MARTAPPPRPHARLPRAPAGAHRPHHPARHVRLPQRIDDEGTYTAQAYAVERFGELTHYTYWYDHPPLGWIQIAGYTWVTDAFDRYDIAVLAAREAMVVYHVVAAGLLWFLARRLGLRRPAAAAALLVFALSPLSVQLSRTVYLDNVALPWAIAAFALALSRRRQLLSFAGAAACLGVAALSKETFLLLLPFLAWTMWRVSSPDTRRYTLSVAGSLLTLVLGFYALLALVKGEVFPRAGQVSLWEGIVFQLVSRDGSGSVLDPGSQAGGTVGVWLNLDAVTPVVAVVGAVALLFVARLRPLAITFLALSAVVFKPGYLPVMYVVMLIPVAALVVGGLLDVGLRHGRRWSTAVTVSAALAVTAVAAPLWGVQLRGLFLADLDRPMREAQTWVSDNVPAGDRVLVDDAVWVDLVRDGRDRDDVVWYYKADTDSDVIALAPNGWADYDYVLVTQALRRAEGTAPTVDQAVQNGTRTAVFGSGEEQVEVFRVDPRGSEAFAAAEDRDLRARTAAGSALLENPSLELSDQAADRLREGSVDARVVSLLAETAGTRALEVADFPAVPGEDGQLPRRTVLLTSVDGETPGSASGIALAAELERRTGQFAPGRIEVGEDELLVRFGVGLPSDLLPVPVGP